MRQQRLLQISLFQQAVGMSTGLGRVAKAEHVAGNHLVTLSQRSPQVMPVPAGGRKAVNQQQRLSLTGRPVADVMAVKAKGLPRTAPIRQGNPWQRRHAA